MGKRIIKTKPEKDKPIVKEVDIRKFWIISVSVVIGAIILVFAINYQSVPYWFGKTDPVAKVAGEPIYKKEAKANLIVASADYKSILNSSIWAMGDKDLTDIKSSVVDDLMNIYSQLNEAKKDGITLTASENAEVNKQSDSYVASFKAQYADEYSTGLKKLSMTDKDFKTEYKKYLTESKIIEKLKKYVMLNDYRKTLKSSDLERITVREIWIDLKSHTQDKAKQIADEIYSKIKSGSKFNDLYSEYKKDVFQLQKNGLIGTIGRGIMPAEFDKVAFSLKIGEISAPVKTKLGYHIIIVDNHTYGNINNLSDSLTKDLLSSDKFTNYYKEKSSEWYKHTSKYKFIGDFK